MIESKSIIILGFGGHGWEVLSSYFAKSTDSISLFGLTSDWGGATGVWGRLLELDDDYLNEKLHGKAIPVLPWGDINKILIYYVNKKYGNFIGDILNLRSYHIIEHLNQFEILSDYLALEEVVFKNFNNYLKEIFAEVEHLSHKLEEIKEPCLGNFWNTYLYWHLGSMDNWNKFYQTKGVLPSNIKIDFTNNSRDILTGIDVDNNLIVGEDIIDIHRHPFLPDKLNIESEAVSSEFLSILEKSDYIIIPNGSIANWLPLTNIPEIQKILVAKSKENKILWFLNLFHTANELQINKYIEYVLSLGIEPLILGPKNVLAITMPQSIIQNYQKEGKKLNFKTGKEIVELKKLLPNSLLELETTVNLQYKYNTESIDSNLFKLINEN